MSILVFLLVFNFICFTYRCHVSGFVFPLVTCVVGTVLVVFALHLLSDDTNLNKLNKYIFNYSYAVHPGSYRIR